MLRFSLATFAALRRLLRLRLRLCRARPFVVNLFLVQLLHLLRHALVIELEKLQRVVGCFEGAFVI